MAVHTEHYIEVYTPDPYKKGHNKVSLAKIERDGTTITLRRKNGDGLIAQLDLADIKEVTQIEAKAAEEEPVVDQEQAREDLLQFMKWASNSVWSSGWIMNLQSKLENLNTLVHPGGPTYAEVYAKMKKAAGGHWQYCGYGAVEDDGNIYQKPHMFIKEETAA